MQQLVCEMCGGTDLVKEEGVFVCKTCGCKYSIEEARKLMGVGTIDVTGSTVKVDVSTELKNLYELARRAKTDGNSENAEKYYGQIITKDPSNWEANFYTTYYQAMNCKIGEIGLAASRVTGCEETVFQLIKDNVADKDEQQKAVNEVAEKLLEIGTMLFNGYKNHYDGIGYQIKANYTQSYIDNCYLATMISYTGGNLITKIFGDAFGEIAVPLWKLGINQHKILIPSLAQKETNKNTIMEYVGKVQKFDSSYPTPNIDTTSGGCYVATAVYGSYDCPEVWTLRRYRDYDLAESWYGRAFIHIYYAISPTIVKWFGSTEWFKKMWRGKLDRMVKKLQDEGFDSTPYEDKNWN